MKYYVISEEEALKKGIRLEDRGEIFDYISVESMIGELENFYEGKYSFTEASLLKAKDYVMYKMDNPYDIELVLDSLLYKKILS